MSEKKFTTEAVVGRIDESVDGVELHLTGPKPVAARIIIGKSRPEWLRWNGTVKLTIEPK